MSALTVADIDTAVAGEPRIEDIKLGFSLGMKNPASAMRQLIGRHMEALKRFGEVCVTVTQTSSRGGRPGQTYWLNLRQALYLATKSEAENAVDLTVEMVDLFAAARESRQVSAAVAQTDHQNAALRPGHALMRVGTRTFLVDTRRFKVGAGERAVRMHFDGRISVGPVDYRDDHQNWFGTRKGYTPPHRPGPNDPLGAKAVRTLVQVIGAVVEEVKGDAPKLPSDQRAGIGSGSLKALPADVRRQVEMQVTH